MSSTQSKLIEERWSGLQTTFERGLDQLGATFRGRWGAARASFDKPLVIHGTGQMGLEADRLLRLATGAVPVAFTDNDAGRWGTSINGVDVMSPDAAVAQWRSNGVFVAALYNPAAVLAQFRAAGASVVVPWTWMFAADPEHFLPYWGLDAPDRIFMDLDQVFGAFDIWADDTSRLTYLEQVQWLIDLDSAALSPRLALDDAYFDPTLVALSDHEHFVDCGAFDGDSFEFFRQRTEGRFASAHLIEPDPENFEDLRRWHHDLSSEQKSRIALHNCALGESDGIARFAAKGGVDSSLDTEGECEVKICTLDSLVGPSDASFIKVDVEGGEMDLLAGASNLLAHSTSTWTVMTYHRPQHLWQIPLELSKYEGRSLHLRRYAEDCWERCAYAIPAG